MRVSAVILAAGRGRRMERDKNKVYLPICGKPLLEWTLSSFARSNRIDEIVLVVRHGEEGEARTIRFEGGVPLLIVNGGETRRDSSLAGVETASGEIVLIHDGARPFVSNRLIERVTDGAIAHGACIPVIPFPDTLRFLNDDKTVSRDPIDRARIVRVQTPQGFRRELILTALENSDPRIPDDAEAILAAGRPVFTVEGDPMNLKVTRPADIEIADTIAALVDSGR